MKSTRIIIGALSVALLSAASANAANLIKNGSFETGDFTSWTFLNNSTLAYPTVVLDYNSNAPYGTGGGAFGEAVPVDNAVPVNPFAGSPDAAGAHAAYFVDDYAVNDSLQQLTYLTPGHYEIGFDAYLPYNGAANPKDASFTAAIINVPVTSFSASQEAAGTWVNYGAVADITQAGYYTTSFTYDSFGYPAKDIVIDKVYVVKSLLPATALIPPTPTFVPEPASWALMLIGFGGVGSLIRGRRRSAVAA